MRKKLRIIGICICVILLATSCPGIELLKTDYPTVLSFNLSALVGAKKILLISPTSSRGKKATNTSTLYVIDASGNFIPINLVDQNGNMWTPQKLLKAGATSLTLDVENGIETRTILVNQNSGDMYDLSASLKQFGDQSAVQTVIEDDLGISWCQTSGIVYKIDPATSTVLQINNGTYNSISSFIPVNGKVLTPTTLFVLGSPPITIDVASLFSIGIDHTCIYNGQVIPSSTMNFGVYDIPIYDQTNRAFWQLGYSWLSIDSVRFGLMKTTLSSSNTLEGQWIDKNTNLGGIYGVIVEPNSSFFDTSRRYVLPYVPAVAVLSFDPNLGTPTVSVLSISSATWDSIATSAHAFLGTSYLIYKNSIGLYSTNYQTNTTMQLYPSSSIVNWSINGQNIIVTAYIDSVNTKTMKIKPDGSIVDATETDIAPQQLITF